MAWSISKTIEYQRNYRIKNRKKYQLYHRAYYLKNRKKFCLRTRKWKKDNKEKCRTQYRRDYFKEKVRRIVRHAIRDGKIKKTPCQDCGDSKIVHGHHPDYSKPLQVIWVCPACHQHYHHNLPYR